MAIKGIPEKMRLVEKYFLKSNHIQDLTTNADDAISCHTETTAE